MKADNLQEMIKTDDRDTIFSDAKSLFTNWDEEKNDDFSFVPFDNSVSKYENNLNRIGSPTQPSAETELIPQESVTEDDLIAYTKFLHARMAISTVQCYWLIGKSILSFYKGKYGTGELQKLSEATGIGRDSLSKACKFARQFTEDQVKDILKGKFVLSWFELAQSLTVAPQNLITAYQASSSPSEFHNAIIKLKPPAPRKGTVISTAVSDRGQVAKDSSDGLKDGENLFDEISSPLEVEISDLRATITERDGEIAELQNLLKKKIQDLSVRDDAINSLRRFLGKIRLNLERKTDHTTLFEMVLAEEWVYEKKFGYLKASNHGAELAG